MQVRINEYEKRLAELGTNYNDEIEKAKEEVREMTKEKAIKDAENNIAQISNWSKEEKINKLVDWIYELDIPVEDEFDRCEHEIKIDEYNKELKKLGTSYEELKQSKKIAEENSKKVIEAYKQLTSEEQISNLVSEITKMKNGKENTTTERTKIQYQTSIDEYEKRLRELGTHYDAEIYKQQHN